MLGHFGNTPCNNWQSTNTHAFVPFMLPKLVFGNEIFSGKADMSAPCIIPKAAFAEEVDDDNSPNKISFSKADECVSHIIFKAAFAKEVDDNDFGNKILSGKADESASCIISKAFFTKEADNDDIDFELASCGRICRANKLSARDN